MATTFQRRFTVPTKQLRRRGKIDGICGVVVVEPETNEQVAVVFEQLVDDYGQECGDAFLAVCDSLCEQRGLVDKNGRRTHKSRQLTP